MLWNALLRLIARAGLRRLRGLGLRLSKSMMRRNSAPVRVTRVNLRLLYPDASADELERMTEEVCQHFCCYLMEALYAWGAAEKVSQHCEGIDGLEAVQACMDEGVGVMLLTPHFGSTEFATIALSDILPNNTAMYRVLRPASLYRSIRPQRFGYKCHAVDTSIGGMKRMQQYVAKGGAALVAPDIVPRTAPGETVPFFGIPVKTGTMIPRMARKVKARIFFYGGIRTETGFRVKVVGSDPEMTSVDSKEAVLMMNQGLEKIVSEDMTQGHWFLKRFSSNPDFRRLYREARLGRSSRRSR